VLHNVNRFLPQNSQNNYHAEPQELKKNQDLVQPTVEAAKASLGHAC